MRAVRQFRNTGNLARIGKLLIDFGKVYDSMKREKIWSSLRSVSRRLCSRAVKNIKLLKDK
jgi:hypothetical protein